MSELRIATANDLSAVAAVLADAFTDDPVFEWAFPDPRSRPRLLQAMFGFMAEHLYLPHGASVVSDESAALWQPAGVSEDDGFWAEHGGRFVAAIEGQMERLGTLAAAMAEHHPSDDCWYLLAIGVRPSAQGRGWGGRTLALTLDRIDATGQAAYLEATSVRSRSLYERHGFEVIDQFSAADSPPLWSMWREPVTNGN